MAWIAGSLALLVAITALALYCWRSRPYLLVGWLWFLGLLAPVSGIMPVGDSWPCPRRPLHLPEPDRSHDRGGLARVGSSTGHDNPNCTPSGVLDALGSVGSYGAGASRRGGASDHVLARR